MERRSRGLAFWLCGLDDNGRRLRGHCQSQHLVSKAGIRSAFLSAEALKENRSCQALLPDAQVSDIAGASVLPMATGIGNHVSRSFSPGSAFAQ